MELFKMIIRIIWDVVALAVTVILQYKIFIWVINRGYDMKIIVASNLVSLLAFTMILVVLIIPSK